MAVQTEEELEDLFQAVTSEITGLDANRGVRIAYAPDGQPAWKINENVACINISPIDDPYDKQQNISYTDDGGVEHTSTEGVFYTRVIVVDWSFFGPASFDLADKVRSEILSNASSREQMTDLDVYPIPGIPAPVKVPYNFNGQWWKRVDLRARFNVGTLRTSTVNNFESIPITVKSNAPGQSGGPSVVIDIPLEE